MKTWLALFTGFGLWAVCAPGVALEPVTTRSQSGQFIVRGLPVGQPLFRAPSSGSSTSAVNYLRLDPTLIAVSFERIKQALLEELALGDKWRGTVYISVHPLREAGEDVVVTSVRYTDGWSYRIKLPEVLDRERFIRAAVQVLLAEIANRKARTHQAELPPWLAEGFAAHLQSAALSTLAVEPETATMHKARRPDPLRRARETLRDRAPLTLNELNMPTEEQLVGRDAAFYQSCAQVFVGQLLRLKNGRQRLREMLLTLAEHFNWQTAFLRAFQNHFPRLIDADKWWALQVIHLTGRDPASVWPHETTWNQLDDILATPLQVRLDPKALPMTTPVKLQTILAEWDFPRQLPVVQKKLDHLQALSQRASPGLAGLVADYRAALAGYLQRRDKLSASLGAKAPTPASLKSLVHETVRRLDELDARRESLRQEPEETAAVN